MKRFITMGSIDQFRTVVKNVQRAAQFVSYDEDTKEVTLNKEAKMPKVVATGTEKIHGCFEKNSLVTLANGEQVPISKIKEGVYILSYNHETKQQEVKKVIKSINQKLKKDWCKLVFDKSIIICTKDHKIWTENRGYVEAQLLKETDTFQTI